MSIFKIKLQKNRKMTIALSSVIFLFAIDRVLKLWALQNLYNTRLDVINDWLSFELVQNTNIAFSIPIPSLLLVPLIIIVITALAWQFAVIVKEKFSTYTYALLLVIIGALSNLYDRLIYGAVVDYINISIWPVFNMADALISIGVVVAILSMIIESRKDNDIKGCLIK